MNDPGDLWISALDAARARARQRLEWEAVVPRWKVPAMDGPSPPIHRQLIEMADVRDGQRALDLACGTGCAPLLQRLGPGGTLLGLDLSPGMILVANQWAERLRHPRVTFRAISAETDLGVASTSFDVATCFFGLMYMPEPLGALRSLREALIPGGRVAVCTWSTLEKCPFLGVPLAIIRRHVAHPTLDLNGPHPFAIPTESALAGLLIASGFSMIQTATARRPADPLSPEAYWEHMEATGWPLAFLPALPSIRRRELRDDMIATLNAMFPDGYVRLGGEAILAVATRPE